MIRAGALALALCVLPATAWAEALSAQQREVVQRFAPVLLQTISKCRSPRWDFITRADFDGDRRANNNEQSMRAKRPMEAALYYAIVETKTHYFLTYSVFHPLDSDCGPRLPIYTWHENDMENLQVVIAKGAPMQVVLLATQAHLKTHFYAAQALKEGAWDLSKRRIAPGQRLSSVRVSVEAGGHGLRMTDVQERPEKVLVFRPGGFGPGEMYRREQREYRYRLLSTYDELWAPHLRGEEVGNGKLLDQRFDYAGPRRSHKGIPRHFDSDQLSGPGKKDAGILPFAFSNNLTADDLGVLFFDPAMGWAQGFVVPEPWSQDYVHHPY